MTRAGTLAPRSVICTWCGNRYPSAIPDDLDRGLQGSHCASDVVHEGGQWIIRGSYGSDEHDMHRYVFITNLPSAPADPVCDECVSQRLRDGDLREDPPEHCRRPDDFAPRPPGTHGLVDQIRRLLEDVTAMRALVSVATRTAGTGPSELDAAVREYQKHQRWTGELNDGGETYAEGAPEVARQLREAAQDLERHANFWERSAQRKPPLEGARQMRGAMERLASSIDDLFTETDAPFTSTDYQRKRASLEQRFLTTHGTHAEDIDTAIHRGVLPCNDPLVEEWTALQALAPYIATKDA